MAEGNGLLQLFAAAQFVEKQSKPTSCDPERGSEVLDDHGYASSCKTTKRPVLKTKRAPPKTSKFDRPSPRPWTGDKNVHNQKEKSRRADLRELMNNLKELLPDRNGMDKLTMLQLLKCARHHIKYLEEICKKRGAMRARRISERSRLQSKLKHLQRGDAATDIATAPSMPDRACDDVDIVGLSSSEEDEIETDNLVDA